MYLESSALRVAAVVTVFAMALCAYPLTKIAAQGLPLLENPGFLADPNQPGVLLVWRTFQHEGVYEIRVDTSQPGLQDGSSVRITGVQDYSENTRGGVSQNVPLVQDGTYSVYELKLRYKGDVRTADYLVWARSGDGTVDLHAFKGILPTPVDDWTEVVVELVIPEEIRTRPDGFRLELILYGRGAGTIWYDYAQLTPKS